MLCKSPLPTLNTCMVCASAKWWVGGDAAVPAEPLPSGLPTVLPGPLLPVAPVTSFRYLSTAQVSRARAVLRANSPCQPLRAACCAACQPLATSERGAARAWWRVCLQLRQATAGSRRPGLRNTAGASAVSLTRQSRSPLRPGLAMVLVLTKGLLRRRGAGEAHSRQAALDEGGGAWELSDRLGRSEERFKRLVDGSACCATWSAAGAVAHCPARFPWPAPSSCHLKSWQLVCHQEAAHPSPSASPLHLAPCPSACARSEALACVAIVGRGVRTAC